MAIKIGFIDISKPLESVYVDGRYESFFAVVNWGYLPIALVELRNYPPYLFEPKHLKSKLLNAAGYRLWELSASGQLNDLRGSQCAMPPISVVVCTRDRPVTLDRCLSALQKVDYPEFEVIVVDNASRMGNVAQVVANRRFHYVREDRPGLDWARNRGVLEANHDLIAYIDDDAYATPGWLRGIAHGFANDKIMAVTGMVLPAELETQAQKDFENYGGMSKGFESFEVEWGNLHGPNRFWASSWGVGANMAFRRQVFERVGMFDPALDVGTATRGGGDIEFFFRIVASGYRLRYEPAAMVQHVHRRSHEDLLNQIRDNGRALPAFLMVSVSNFPELQPSIFWFATRWWLGDWVLKRLFSNSPVNRRWALTELKGSLGSLDAYRHSRKTVTNF
jgi:glycosyltransferase involved in cell wall biosynthesis